MLTTLENSNIYKIVIDKYQIIRNFFASLPLQKRISYIFVLYDALMLCNKKIDI